jgi:predicted O-methyltransferase YrrM
MRQTIVADKLVTYMAARSAAELPVMAELRQRTEKLGTAARMQIDQHQGQVMALLLQMIGARRVLEIGSFTGMSALWMARALPDVSAALPDGGELHCCDINGEWTDIARWAWREGGLDHKITLHLAPALETLPKFQDGSFDAVFVDADKGNYPGYIAGAHRLLRTGGLLMIDNTLQHGDVAEPHANNKVVETIRGVNDALAANPKWQSVILPIGDGLTVAIKNPDQSA